MISMKMLTAASMILVSWFAIATVKGASVTGGNTAVSQGRN